MKRFHVTVNGTVYDVAVEEAAADAPHENNQASQQAVSPRISDVPEGTPVSAPMSGTILEVNVSEGDTVRSGQSLMVLEAMKMANDVAAPSSGVVAAVLIQKGAQVESGETLLILQQEA